MEEIIRENSDLVSFLIAVLASVGGVYLLILFLKKWQEVEIEAKENKKFIEYYGLIIAFIAILLSIFSIIYSGLSHSKSDDLDRRIEILEQGELDKQENGVGAPLE